MQKTDSFGLFAWEQVRSGYVRLAGKKEWTVALEIVIPRCLSFPPAQSPLSIRMLSPERTCENPYGGPEHLAAGWENC